MLDDATVLDSEQVIVRRRGHSPGFDYSEDEVTLRDVSARDEHGCCARLCHFRYPGLKPRNPVTDLGRMLKVVIIVMKSLTRSNRKSNGTTCLNLPMRVR